MGILWASRAVVVAVIGDDLELVGVSPHLADLVGRPMVGEPATALVAPGQAHALATALQDATAAWSDMILGLATGAGEVPLDYRIRVARLDGRVLLVGEPAHMDGSAVGDQLLEVTEDLISEQRRMTRDRVRLDRLTTTDPLTDLGNRRRLEHELAERMAAAAAGEPLSVVFADIDHFKAINDELGHAAGDDVLRAVSDMLVATCRADDLVTRYGGEEFVAVLPRTGMDGAARWAERARATVAARIDPALGRAVTASFGVAELQPGESADDLLARADAALFVAKGAGRNRVARAAGPDGTEPVVASQPPPPARRDGGHAPRLSEVIWQSAGIGVAEFDAAGRLLGANGTFRRLLGEGLEGKTLADLVAWTQAAAVAAFVASAGTDWVRGSFGLAADREAMPIDRVLWLRRTDTRLDLLVDVDPALPEETAGPLMGLVDDLVATQRELSRSNQRLQQTLADLEAASLEVEHLRTVVPMCAWCRRIRLDGPAGPEWLSTEEFLHRDSVDVSHGICDECSARVEHAVQASTTAGGPPPRPRRAG